MNYELAKELKDAGFPQDGGDGMTRHMNVTGLPQEAIFHPTLEELIETCGEFGGFELRRAIGYGSHEGYAWKATLFSPRRGAIGATPTEAVARLWLALNKPNTTTKVSS